MAKREKQYVVGFDLGGTKMLSVVYDADWKAIGRRRRKTKAFTGAKAGLERIAETISDSLADAGIEADALAAIGIGAPGPLDPERGVLLDLPNLGWKNVPLRDHMQKLFGCPVSVLNDVDAGVYGEYSFGAGKGNRCVLGVFPGTGIGGGCVYEGTVIRGRNISAMEIGHICVQPDGPLCGCGRRGCLEAVASRLAISQAAVAAAYRGEAPYLQAQIGTDLAKVRSGVLCDAIANGDKAIEDIVRTAAAWLGRGIASTINLLAPDVVVLGGGLAEAMPKLYLESVETAARGQVMPSFVDTFKVVVAKLGDDSTIRGAGAWALAELKKART